MQVEYIKHGGVEIAVVTGTEPVITDAASALDRTMTVRYETGAERTAIGKSVITEDFFIFSTGLTGEILQKWISCHIKTAVLGDCSRYTSKPLRNFIYESNQGKDLFFAETRKEALERLAGARQRSGTQSERGAGGEP